MLKKIFCLTLAMLVFVSALSISAFADFERPAGSCPLCGFPVEYSSLEVGSGFVYDGSTISCTNPNCSFYKRHINVINGLLWHKDFGTTGGTPSSRSNTVTVPKNYYTTNNTSSTTNSYNTVNSGNTNHYSTINTTNQTLNYTTYNRTTNNYTYNTYNYTNYTYNYDYNYYTVNVDNSTHYVIDNVNYITVLYPTGEYVQDENGNDVPEYDYTDIYYQLPDGRNSYDLTAADVWGTYFVYNVTSCDKVAEDDGATLGLWHLDGDLKDSSYHAGAIVPSFGSMVFRDSADYSSDLFGQCLYGNSSKYGQVFSFPKSSLIGNTLEFLVYLPDSDSLFFSFPSTSSVDTAYDYAVGSFYTSSTTNYRFALRLPLSSGFHAVCIQFGSIDVLSGEPFMLYLDGSSYDVSSLYARYANGPWLSDVVLEFPLSVRSGSVEHYAGDYFHVGFYNDTQFLDEVRLSRGHLHDSNYTPSLQPFDTNSVLVLPANPADKDIAIMSNIPVGDYRIGGVRPTYPATGDVYIYLENDVVESVQQYQGDGWAAVDAQIYTNGTWQNLKKFNLATVKAEEIQTSPATPTPPPATPTPTPGGPSGCAHQYTITAQKEPTCIESGYKIYKCDLCGNTYTDTLKALGHDWQIVPLESALSNAETPDISAAPDVSPPPDESGSETADPTPAPSPEYTLYRCSRCGQEYRDFDGSGPPANKDDDSEGGILGWIKKLIKSIWGGILSILETIFGGTISLVCSLIDDLVAGVNHVITGLFDALGQIADFGGGFKDFLGAFFSFVPSEIITLLAFSISLGIILMIIKFFRG